MQTNFTNRLALAMQIDPAVLWEHFPNGVTINDLQRFNEILSANFHYCLPEDVAYRLIDAPGGELERFWLGITMLGSLDGPHLVPIPDVFPPITTSLTTAMMVILTKN
ncbi:hypothetical protein [Limosilactobacillus fermentum]|uniref:hypothetical protein n=1 Tax=Limosilactobacillus fermentum TaxID=1613 RepID=UPI0030D3D32D